MGIFDKAKDLLGQHPDKVDQGIDKAAGFADQRSGGQHTEQIDKGAGVAKEKAGKFLREDGTTPPPA